MADDSTATFIDIVVAIFVPPLGVFLKFACGIEFWICLLLTFFAYIPGIVYAVYAITK
ncbi:hydrophobic protein RCI2A [Sesamum indicum]|uniref:Hydrophobic protein RCI2A n=1 Tax=Sesamum indicum TaxID=4182 RepID=A0A6I9U5J0_SESIN|nr:hydrophobic protein RCI2A [Sesamum indicum]